MKKLLLTTLLSFTALSFHSCTEETTPTAPTIVGNWKLEKVKIAEYTSGFKDWDTTINNWTDFTGETFFYNLKSDKTFDDKTVNKNSGSVVTETGTYNFSGTNLTLNYKDLNIDEFESVSFDDKRLIMTQYDPSKTDPDRSIFTWEFSRQ